MNKKSEYAKKLLDPRWQKKRLEVFQRDGFKCQCCGAVERTLHAHHSYYDRSADGPWDYPIGSLVTLCEDCHGNEHVFMGDTKESLHKAICNAGFSTTERQFRILWTLNLLSNMSADDIAAFDVVLSRFVGERATRLGLQFGADVLSAIGDKA